MSASVWVRSHWATFTGTMDGTGATVGSNSAGGALRSGAEVVDSLPFASSRTTTLPSISTRPMDHSVGGDSYDVRNRVEMTPLGKLVRKEVLSQ